MRPRATTSSPKVPEELNASLRAKLRLARTQRGMMRNDVKVLSAGTMSTYENIDISSMSLGALHGLSVEFGWTLPEMFTYLAGEVDDSFIDLNEKQSRRVALYIRSLSPALRQVACDMLVSLVDYQSKIEGGPSKKALHIAATVSTRDTDDRSKHVDHVSSGAK